MKLKPAWKRHVALPKKRIRAKLPAEDKPDPPRTLKDYKTHYRRLMR